MSKDRVTSSRTRLNAFRRKLMIASLTVMSITASSTILAIPASAASSTSDHLSPVASQKITVAKAPEISDDQLNELLSLLEGLPENLKLANPAATTNYSSQLRRELSYETKLPAANSVSPQFSWGWLACVAALASFVAQYGIPIWKVIRWVREAKAIWGGVVGIWNAIRSGAAAAELGEDAADVLEGILGVGGVVDHCF